MIIVRAHYNPLKQGEKKYSTKTLTKEKPKKLSQCIGYEETNIQT